MRFVLSLICVVAGISFLLYPTLKDLYFEKQQKELLESWEQISGHEGPTLLSEAENSMAIMERAFAGESSVDYDNDLINDKVEPNDEPQPIYASTIGVIEIPKIKVKLPILVGSDDKILDVGAGFLEGTALPGEEGNSAIAAHRSRTYGKMFNRLGELAEGDKIFITTDKGTFLYTVNKTFVVQPNDISVLNANGNRKILTLITCDPVINPTHRLIVQAEGT
jgi:sortase A